MKNLLEVEYLRSVWGLLSSKDRRLASAYLLVSLFLGILDILSVALFGVIGALTVGNLSGQSPGNRISFVLEKLLLEGLTFQRQVFFLSVISLGFAFLRFLFATVLYRKQTKFFATKSAVTSSKIFNKLLLNPELFQQGFRTEELKFSVTRGIDSIFIGVISTVLLLFADIFLFAILLTGLLIVSPSIFLVTVFYFVLIGILITKYSHPKTIKLGKSYANLQIQGDALVHEAIQSYRTIFVGNRQVAFVNKLLSNRIRLSGVVAEIDYLPVQAKAVVEMSIYLLLVVVSGILFATSDAKNSIGVLAIYVGVLSRVGPAALRVQQSWTRINASLMSAIPTFNLIKAIEHCRMSETQESTYHIENHRYAENPAIEMSQVNFKYHDNDKPAIIDCSIQIKKGEFLAIIGKSGAGKSTLVDLILGILAPSSGKILLDGQSPKNALKNNLIRIAYVPQETFLMHGTLRENILQGLNPNEYDDNAIYAALNLANLKEFVEGMQDKLDTYLGDGRNSLSGGQKQRIGIARALLTNPELIILDEPTSSLDQENQSMVASTLEDISGEMTLIVIAHNLETIKNADRICIMEDGRILSIEPNFDFRKDFYLTKLQ